MKPIRLPIVNVDRKNRTAIVESTNGRFPVKSTIDLTDVRCGDDAMVVKSNVSGEWLMIDYRFDNAFNYALHNSMQTNTDDLIVDKRGVPYEF